MWAPIVRAEKGELFFKSRTVRGCVRHRIEVGRQNDEMLHNNSCGRSKASRLARRTAIGVVSAASWRYTSEI